MSKGKRFRGFIIIPEIFRGFAIWPAFKRKPFGRPFLKPYFLKTLFKKENLTWKTTQPLYKNRLKEDFALIQKAKALFQALYSQQDLEKAIGNLSFQDCLNLCQQTEKHIAPLEKKQPCRQTKKRRTYLEKKQPQVEQPHEGEGL